MAGKLLLLAQNEGQLHHLSQPLCEKPATEMHKWHVLCSLQNLLTPLSPLSLFNPSAKRKRLEVYLLYFLMIALWCKMCRKYLLLSLKTLESLHTHCELGKSLSCHFTYRHAYGVTEMGWHRTEDLSFTLWPPFWIMYYSAQCPPFYLKSLKNGNDVKEYGFYCDSLLQRCCYSVTLIQIDQSLKSFSDMGFLTLPPSSVPQSDGILLGFGHFYISVPRSFIQT